MGAQKANYRVHPRETLRFQHSSISYSVFREHCKMSYCVDSCINLGNIQRSTLLVVTF